MSSPKKPDPAKFLVSIFMKEKKMLMPIIERLISIFGEIDILSGWFDFNFTEYYYNEMGRPLFRRMAVFKDLMEQDILSNIKIRTNEVEKEFSSNENKRSVNIDTGYMLRERFVLATGKNFSHRIYIGNNIYADLTLIFHKGAFKTLPWTYPDYADKDMIRFLTKVRAKYISDLKEPL